MPVRISCSTLLLVLVAACAHNSPKPGGGMTAATGCATQETLCWDFEEGALPAGWTAHRDEFNGQLLVDDSRAHSGRYALHAKELAYWMNTSEPDPENWFPLTQHLLDFEREFFSASSTRKVERAADG